MALRAAGRGDDARDVGGAWISTIHGLCSRLLRRHAFEAGVDPLFSRAGHRTDRPAARGGVRDSGRQRLAAGRRRGAASVRRVLLTTRCSRRRVAVARELAVAGLWRRGHRTGTGGGLGRAAPGEAQAFFRLGMTTCDLGYSGTSADPLGPRRSLRGVARHVLGLVSAERDEEELLSELLGALEAYKPLRKTQRARGDGRGTRGDAGRSHRARRGGASRAVREGVQGAGRGVSSRPTRRARRRRRCSTSTTCRSRRSSCSRGDSRTSRSDTATSSAS